jgi:perosamine synthetase
MRPDSAKLALIPLSEPLISGNEWAYVKECLDTSWVSSAGKFVDRFEAEFKTRLGVRHAVAVASGTAALHVAVLAAGVKPGDEVLVSTLTFIAPANAIQYAGAHPVFVDADPSTWQMDVEAVLAFLERCRQTPEGLINPKSGRRIGGLLPVHILGHPVDLGPLVETARRHKLPVIEDATEALGASYRGRPVGTIGDVGCFSFNGNKLITTGAGGMVVTSRQDIADKARYLSTQAKDDPIEYVHEEVGYNYRLSNVQAAIGCAQLEHIDTFLSAKRRIASRYAEGLADCPGVRTMPSANWASPAFWLYTVLIEGGSREAMRKLGQAGVQSRPLWRCVHSNKPYRGNEVLGGSVAEDLQRDALSLPCSVGLSDSDQERVITALRRSLAG